MYEPPPQKVKWDWVWRKWIEGFWRHQEERGTWTPEYDAATTAPSSITYDTQNGQWIKHGGMVTLWFQISTDALTVGSGRLYVTGLPYPNKSEFRVQAPMSSFSFVGADGTFNSAKPVHAAINADDDKLRFVQADGTTAVNADAGFLATGANSNNIRGYISYPVEV